MARDHSFKDTERCCCLRPRPILVLICLGVVFLVLGMVLKPVIDDIFRKKIDENLILSPGSPTYDSWREPTIPIYAKHYFFNVLNAEEVRQGKKPFVEERGPYSYFAYTEKVNITWNDENATVTYDQKTWYEFDPKTSCPSCDPFLDEITTVNIPLVTVAEIMKTYPDYLHWKRLVSLLLERFSEPLFMTRTVQELLWGYKDPLLAEVERLREEAPSMFKPYIPKLDATIVLQPNNTLQGLTTVHTGAKDIRNVEMWKSWKRKDRLDIWLTKYANMINGTDGRQFVPRLSKTDTLYFVVIQLCRSLYVTYDHALQDQDIEVYRYVIPPEVFLNGTADADNAAFYPQGFLPTGILDPRKCQGGNVSAPVFISAPHFYLGDPRLVDALVGLKPNKEKHELSFDVEPNLGVPLTNAIRLQVNVFLEPVKDITETSGILKVYLPVMWFEESATLDSDTTALFRNDIIIPMKICHDVEIALICIGSFVLFVEFVIVCYVTCSGKKKRLTCCYGKEEQELLVNSKQGVNGRNNNLENGS